MKKGTRDATSGRAYPEPWLIAPNGEALPIQMGNTVAGVYIGKRNSDGGEGTGPITVHDIDLDAKDDGDPKRIVVWGGPSLTWMLADVSRGERVHFRYLGSYMTEFGPIAYRWQLWRELNGELP